LAYESGIHGIGELDLGRGFAGIKTYGRIRDDILHVMHKMQIEEYAYNDD